MPAQARPLGGGTRLHSANEFSEVREMDSFKKARTKIFAEITIDDPEVRAEYLTHFKSQAKEFSEVMAQVMLTCLKEHGNAQGNEKRVQVFALVYMAIYLHIGSMKLLLSGNMVASGNLFRQTLETVALALLCAGKDLNFLDRFNKDQYSTNFAIRDLLKNVGRLKLKADGVKALQDGQKFYHKYSHVTKLTIGAAESFTGEGIYVGASFDKGKLESYAKEVAVRLNLARVLNSFVAAVKANVAKW